MYITVGFLNTEFGRIRLKRLKWLLKVIGRHHEKTKYITFKLMLNNMFPNIYIMQMLLSLKPGNNFGIIVQNGTVDQLQLQT